METKICSKCNTPKPLDEFADRSGRPGKHSWCILCKNSYDKQSYHSNPSQRQAVRRRKKESVDRNVAHVKSYLSSHPCVDCGETDVIVLEFDHVRGKKTLEVSVMVRRGCSIQTIDKEITKCEVRCANDHKRRTRERKHSPVVQRQNT